MRSFAVLFDTPIGDACGLKVLDLLPGARPGELLPEPHTVRCDLSSLATRPVSDASLELP